jgi:hypothetical protein
MPPLKCAAIRRPAAAYPSNFQRLTAVIPAFPPLAQSFSSAIGPAQEFCPILPLKATGCSDSPQKAAGPELQLFAPAVVEAASVVAPAASGADEAFFSAAEIEAAFRCVSGVTVCSELSDDWSCAASARASPCMDELLIFSLDL